MSTEGASAHDERSPRGAGLRALLLGRTRFMMLGAGMAAALLVLGSWLLGSGEVVQLTVADEGGRLHQTNLWIVELDGTLYVRAGQGDAVWLSRLRARPGVTLSREGSERRFVAVPDEGGDVLLRVGRAMEVKYGFSDRLWGQIADRSRGVAIRLEPLGEDEAEPVGND